MKVEITKKELHEALAGFSRVISRKTTLPVLHGIRFAAKDGQLHATATDLEQAATYTFASAVVARQGVCVVSCEALRPFAKGRDQEIVTMDAGEVLLVSHQISGHSISEQIPTFDAAEFPPDLPDIPTRKVEGHFLECFHRAQIFASRDETRPVLNTVRLEVSGQAKGDCIVATDGRRLISYNSQELPIKAGCNVKPTKFLNSLQHEPDMEIGEQTINDAQYFALKNGRWSYIARTVDGAYPNWRQVIPKYNNPRMLQFSDANAAVLTKVLPGFAGHDQKDGPITLVARHGRIKIYGLNKETGKWSVLALDEVGYQGGDSMVCLNRQFLLDVLRVDSGNSHIPTDAAHCSRKTARRLARADADVAHETRGRRSPGGTTGNGCRQCARENSSRKGGYSGPRLCGTEREHQQTAEGGENGR